MSLRTLRTATLPSSPILDTFLLSSLRRSYSRATRHTKDIKHIQSRGGTEV
jgi:hypothetical protein